MNNSFLNGIGLGNMDLGIVITVMALIILILLIISITNTCSVNEMKKTYKKFMSGKTAKSLEDEITGLFEDNKFIKNAVEKNRKDIGVLFHNFESAFQKIGIVKYDAFHEMGGKLSFAICMLDKNDNGCLVNVMHSNNGCFAYIKEIINGESFIELGDEEANALKQAVAGRMGDVELSREVNDIVNN